MNARLLIGATAFIWIFIKLPQEWWIHVAPARYHRRRAGAHLRGAGRDVMGRDLRGAAMGRRRGGGRRRAPARRGLVGHHAQAAARGPRPDLVTADAEPGRADPPERLAPVRAAIAGRLFGRELGEKVALITLVSIIFGQVLEVRGDPAQLAFVIALVVVSNAALSTLLARRGVSARARSRARRS